MSYQDLTVDEFLGRVLYMPDMEAEQGFTKKTARVMEIGKALSVVGADNSRINEALKMVRKRIEATNWSKAVTAIYGQEGYERCKVWMIQNNPERSANYQGDLNSFMDRHGIGRLQ